MISLWVRNHCGGSEKLGRKWICSDLGNSPSYLAKRLIGVQRELQRVKTSERLILNPENTNVSFSCRVYRNLMISRRTKSRITVLAFNSLILQAYRQNRFRDSGRSEAKNKTVLWQLVLLTCRFPVIAEVVQVLKRHFGADLLAFEFEMGLFEHSRRCIRQGRGSCPETHS